MKTCALALLVLLFLHVSSFAGSSVDDCHAEFAAYTGARPYIVNPASERDATTIVAVFDYPASPESGSVAWTLAVRSQSTGEVVRSFTGRSSLVPGLQTSIERRWNGRTAAGTLAPDGYYNIEVDARFFARASRGRSGEPVGSVREERVEASPVTVIVDRAGRYDALFARESIARRRLRHLAASLDPAFPYHFFYGNTHSHTNWSDGGMPVTDCTSGRYGYSGGAQPLDAFSYAKANGGIDFLAIVEHNHLMQEACAGCTAADVIARYGNGFAAAQSATVPGSFVGLWGMEWGVISGGGHVNVYNQPNLMSWTGEPFQVDTPKSDYPALYDALASHQGTLGSYGTFNHPNSSDFGSWVRSASGDSVMRGLAIVSGPAFSTSTSFTPGGTTYGARFNQALSYGWKVAPEAHQDNHCWNFGNATPNRTVALVPAGTAFDQASLLVAMNARRMYAAQDRDVQLRWATADGTRVMGETFAASAAISVRAAVSDPAGEGVQKIEIWGGKAGTSAAPGAAPAVVASILSSDALDAQLNPGPAGEEWYYYVIAVQADGDTVWSAPMWITWNGSGGGGDTTAPSVALTSPANGATVSGSVLVAATASDDTGVARVEFRVDGSLQATRTAAPYEWTWNSTGVANGAHNVSATAFDAAGNSAASSVSVTVSNGSGGGGGTSLDLSGWVLTQANSAYSYTIPAGTTIPAGGYLIVARSATQAAFETFWGATLAANVVFRNAANAMPVINGDETYQLSNGALTVDGPTIAMGASAGQTLQRVNLCGVAGNAASWSIASSTAATPGAGAPAGCGAGARISEFSDAGGTGNYIYEFVEIYNDTAGGTADTTPPSATITAPASGATVSGAVPITVSATDDTGVTSVTIFVDGTAAATLSAAPWQWSWDTTALVNGTHAIGATAYDAAGNAGAATSISVTVDNDLTPPVVSVTSPASGASVSGTVSVAASASDASGIASVVFLLDGAAQFTDTTAPYAWSWDTVTASNGTHTLEARATDSHGNAATSAAVSVTVNNDVTPPFVSLTAPASGATVAGTVDVTASATDASGVASVAFLLNGALQSTDTTAPYAWSWNTASVADGSYTLEARATDVNGNAATSTAVAVNVDNIVVTGTDISGWRVTQSNASLTWYVPAGTVIPSSGYVVIARNATKAAFETFWGVTLGTNVVFINAADAMPQINGSESYSIYNGATRVDGATIAMASSGGESIQRTKPCTGANKAAAWSRLSASSATPGHGAPAPCGKGVFISEFSDALGTGNFVYEFVELHNDR
ncbi:MAG: Ig-like domain-containing protein [Thermoanaerobaculia bacterium]